MAIKKDDYLRIRIDKETKEDIKALADILGISITDLVVWSTLYPERIEVFKKSKGSSTK